MVMAENDQEASGTISKSKSAWKTPAAVAMNGDDAPPPSPVMIGASPDSWPALSDAAAVAAAGGPASKPATVASPPPPPLQVSPNSLLLWCYCLLIRKKRGLAMCNG